MKGNGVPAQHEIFRCSPAARRLPWALGAAMIGASLILSARIDPAGRVPNAGVMRGLLVAVALVIGVRIALSLRELALTAQVRERDVLLELKGRMASIAWDEVVRLDWEPLFRHYGCWPPALVLVHRRGERFRVPALIAGGDRFLADLLARSGRSDLADWAGAHRIEARMARGNWWAAGGYLAAAVVVALSAAAPLG